MKHNVHFFIFFNITLLALFSEWLSFISELSYIVRLLIVFIPQLLINFLLIKSKKIKLETNFEKKDLIFFFVLIAILGYTITLPDNTYDTENYHIYLQENSDEDKLNFDLLAGKVYNTFLFSLGDSMHYIFRYFLGYRAGKIFSLYAILVIFYQLKNTLNIFIKNNKYISIISIGCISSYTTYKLIGSYYIDIFCIVFLLQILYELFRRKEIFTNNKFLIYLSIVIGLSLAIKISNIFIVIPMLLFFAVKNKREIKFSKLPIYILCCIITLIPITPYCINNYIQTGSPIFPYYNNVFKSEYFGIFSWQEERFGIKNIFYGLIWPMYVSLSGCGYGDDWLIKDPIWAIGYITVICIIIYALIFRKANFKIQKELIYMSILALLLNAFWIIFLCGYMRYALIIPIIYYIIISILAINLVNYNKKNLIIIGIFAVLCSELFSYCNYANLSIIIIFFTLYALLKTAINLKNSSIFYGAFCCVLLVFSIYNFATTPIEDISSLFIDRNTEKIHIDGVWGVIGDESALTSLVREDGTPIYNLNTENFNTSEKALELYYEKINNQDIYLLLDSYKYDKKIKQLEENGFSVETVVAEYTNKELKFLDYNRTVQLVKLKYNN